MIKVKDGYAKLIGTTYQGSSTNVLLSNGGNFPIHSGRNNEANKLVRTDSNGQLHTGWINTTSGDLGGAITRIYCSNDSYIRYQTPANFFSSLTNNGNNISITVAGQNRTLQVGYASNSDKVDNRHAISTTPNTGILYKSALYAPASLSSYWVKLASISSIGQNAEFVATIHVQSGHSGLGRSAILLVYLRGDKSSFMSKSFKICCNSNYDPSRFRLYYRDSDKTSEIWYQMIGRWDGIITTVINQSNEGTLYEGLTLYNGHINTVQTPSMSSYITAQVSTITDNISGNATTASQLQTSRTLWGQSFNGTANVSGSLSSVGDIIMSGVMKSSKETSTYIAGNQGNALINSTASAGRYVMLFRGVSTDGYFTHGVYQKSYLLQYTAKSTVDAGTNSVTKSATLLDESGNSTFPGYVTSTGFKKSGSSDSYVLLGGGGHKTIDSFQTNYDGRYVKKSGDTMTGTLTTRNRVYAQLSGRADKVGLFHSSTSNKGGIVLADTNGTEHTLYLTTSNLQWKGRTVWDSGNDGSGSGLDADLLDGTHKSGLFTALSSSSSTNLSITIGGTTKAIADLYATQAVNADKLDNLQATSFMRCDGTNSIGLSGGNGNTAGWRLVLEKNCTNTGWSINNIVFSVTSRHTGQGIMSIGFHTTNEDSTTYSYQINFKGSTNSNTSSPWRAFYNTSTKKFRLFWYYNDYNAAQINVLSRSGFNTPTNGTWYEALPSDNGTELTIYYNNAQTATQLLNSRKINGTSFNGTADITTSAWGATRSITLSGAVTGTVSTNGGGNITINTTYGTGNITNLDNRYVRKAGDTMYGNLAFSTSKQAKWTAHGTSYITDGNVDFGTSLGGDLANLVIASWYGVSFTTSCSGQTYTGKTAVGINCRSGIVYAAKFTGPLQGNATSATQLQTSRKINGTSFNGTTDITTSYWGSTRTLTIGNTGKSVNGSGNVSWSLSEIGAASSNHTHNYITMYRTSQLDSDSFSTYVKNYAKGVTAISNVTATVGNIATTDTVLNVGHSTTRFWRIFSSRGTNASIYFQGPNSDGTGWDTKQKLLTSANSSVSKSGETLTVTINGVTQSLTNTNTTNTTGASNTSSKIFLIGATSQSSAVQTYSHDTAYVGTDGCLYSNNTKVSVEGHTHGTLHSTFTTTLDNTTTDSGWSMINSSYKGFLLKSIRTQSSAPNWIENNYAAGICFGGSDTKGVLSIAYPSPAIKFAGGNGTKPVWWIRLIGASGATYNLANFNAATASKLGTSTIGSTSRPIYLSEGTPIAITASIGSSTSPVYFSSGTITQCSSSSSAVSNTLTVRDGSGDIQCRLVRTSYGNESRLTGGIVFRVNNSSDNYLRCCNSPSAARSWLGVGASGDYVTALGTNGNYLTWTKNGSTSNITIPYSSKSAFLSKNSTFNSTGQAGLQYYDADITNVSNNNTWSGPTSGWHQIIHMPLSVSGYFTELALPVNDVYGLAWRQRRNTNYYGWYRILDNNNYSSYVKKVGTSTVGGTDKPIYLNGGTPTALSSTKGSTSLPVYLNAGTITTCTPSSLFSNLSNSGTKLSISVAGQNRTLTVMYSTSTQYVVSSGNQTALSGTTAANSGIRLYEAYNNGYPISYGNLLSMKGRGSTELLMGWKSGSNRMYYRSNSDINEGWTSWQTVATLADISNAVNLSGTQGTLAYYVTSSRLASYSSTVGSSSNPMYLSSGKPVACTGIVLKSIGRIDVNYNSNGPTYGYIIGGYNCPKVSSIFRRGTGDVKITFNRIIGDSVKIATGRIDSLDENKNIYCSLLWGTSNHVTYVDVVLKNGANRRDGNFVLYIMEF